MFCPYAKRDKDFHKRRELCVEIDDMNQLYIHDGDRTQIQIDHDGDPREAIKRLIGALGTVSEQYTAEERARTIFEKGLAL